MRYVFPTLLAILVFPAAAVADEKDDQQKAGPPEVNISKNTKEVLDKINSVNAYQVPELKLREDKNYASTPDKVGPFRHVEPYKRHPKGKTKRCFDSKEYFKQANG